jgi:hypothetical protein
MMPGPSFLDALKLAADRATAAEDEIRREIATRTKALENERAYAFRRLNIMRSMAEVTAGAESEEVAVAGATAVLRSKLSWSNDSAATNAISDIYAMGHALEMARGSHKTVVVKADALPFLKEAPSLAQQGFVTGASSRNWKSYDSSVTLLGGTADRQRQLYCDPQTSGGLLIACEANEADATLDIVLAAGFSRSAGHRRGEGRRTARCRRGVRSANATNRFNERFETLSEASPDVGVACGGVGGGSNKGPLTGTFRGS